MRSLSPGAAPSTVAKAGDGIVRRRTACRWSRHCCHSASLTASGSRRSFIDSAAWYPAAINSVAFRQSSEPNSLTATLIMMSAPEDALMVLARIIASSVSVTRPNSE